MKSAQPNGYTILELMIVVAISGSMFVLVVITFGGRQQQIQFTQAVRALDARLQDTINDVSSGYYDNPGDVSCSVDDFNATARPVPDATVPSNADDQGTSDECIFVGKAIQFSPNVVDGESTIYVYSIIGRRNNNGTVSNLQMARPVAVAPNAVGNVRNLESKIAKIPLDWDLKVTNVVDNVSPIPTEYGAIGFFTTFSKSFTSGITTTDISNNQLVRFGAIPASILGEDSYVSVQKINSITDQNPASAPDRFINLSGKVISTGANNPITICVRSADNKRRAAIVIGANGTTSTELQFDNYDEVKCDG